MQLWSQPEEISAWGDSKGFYRDLKNLEEYCAIIQDQFDKGITEMVEQTDWQWFYKSALPATSCGCQKNKETTEVRIVYNTSTWAQGPSLNDYLHWDQRDSLCFRSYQVSWIADIEKAKDHDALHFLWVDNPLTSDPNIVMYWFPWVLFGVSSSLYLLISTIQHHLMQYSSLQPDIVKKLLVGLWWQWWRWST